MPAQRAEAPRGARALFFGAGRAAAARFFAATGVFTGSAFFVVGVRVGRVGATMASWPRVSGSSRLAGASAPSTAFARS